MVMPKDPIEREKTKQRMSEAAKKRVRTPEFEAARLAASNAPEARKRQRESLLKHYEDPEQRRLISEATKEAMNTSEIGRAHV